MWICPNCLKIMEEEVLVCTNCKTPNPRTKAFLKKLRKRHNKFPIYKFLGFVLGSIGGYLLSRTIPTLGRKVPFFDSISGGLFLQGLKLFDKPVPIITFCFVLGGAIIGLVIGWFLEC